MKAFVCTASLLAAIAAFPLGVSASSQNVPVSASSTGHAVDNTAVNARDRSDSVPTSSSQPNDASDVKLAAAVRRALMKDTSLSTLAHNVKVIVSAGAVTLRGPVKDGDEKTRVGTITQSVAGVTQVTNELDVKH